MTNKYSFTSEVAKKAAKKGHRSKVNKTMRKAIRARELRDEGMASEDIAKEIGVSPALAAHLCNELPPYDGDLMQKLNNASEVAYTVFGELKQYERKFHASIKRFWNEVDTSSDENDCWTWTKKVNSSIGLQYSFMGSYMPIRFIAYLLQNKKCRQIVAGKEDVVQTCGNKYCVNFEHLLIVSLKQIEPAAVIEVKPLNDEHEQYWTNLPLADKQVMFNLLKNNTREEVNKITGVSLEAIDYYVNTKFGL